MGSTGARSAAIRAGRSSTYYGKGLIFETAAGLRRHQARCVGCRSRSRTGTRSVKAMERVKQRKSAAKEQPIMVEGNGTEEEEISFVAEFKYLVQM